MIKKFLFVLGALALTASLTACTGTSASNDTTSTKTHSEQQALSCKEIKRQMHIAEINFNGDHLWHQNNHIQELKNEYHTMNCGDI